MTYRNVRAVLATKHGKERAIAAPMHEHAGIHVVVANGIDTDALGTFTGEIERTGTMGETAIAKARLGAAAAGIPYSIASEGSFGPHPSVPFLSAGLELLVFVDDEAGVVISEERLETETNFSHFVVGERSDATTWLQAVGFPQHAVIVRPNHDDRGRVTAKGLVDLAAVEAAIVSAARDSLDGRARLETDMRAHMNPTRMRSIAALAEKLGRRLARPCPSCAAPGFGREDVVRGLPCRACATPTEWVRFERWACVRCRFEQDHPRPDGRTMAEPGQCPVCNP